MNEALKRLSVEHGQSPWLDNLQRGYLTSGKLASLVEDGVRGLTSNPTIFQKAIQGSSDYDEQFTKEINSGSSAQDAYWELVLQDIHGALDIFADLFMQSGGTDGFVSVEVDPSLAHDSAGTLSAARLLHERISRPNVMIKIPATSAGIPAIREMIAEGRNVNVTLIFSLARYQDVMDAYIDGLEQRLSSGASISGISSVASFFISRVDNEIDKRLEALATPSAMALRGTAAVNQARLAYAAFQKTFSGPRWDVLAKAGASVQRPLWASTSTKNPSYPDTMYVDELIGPDTVNTLPDATLEAFVQRGTVSRTIDRDLNISKRQWAELAMNAIDVDDVASLLEAEGVASFIKSFDELIEALETKASGLTQ
jgi:transaldolase